MELLNVREIPPNSILIVDDSQPTVTMHTKFARTASKDICIQTAYDGEEAWERFQQNPVAVALLDIEMPKLNGVQLAEKIKRYSPATGIIVFSGNLNTNIMLKFAALEVDFAKKPASEFEVATKIRSALRSFEKDVELEATKVANKLIADLCIKGFDLQTVLFLQSFTGQAKPSTETELLRQVLNMDLAGKKLVRLLCEHSEHKQKVNLLYKVLTSKDPEVLKTIKLLAVDGEVDFGGG